MRNHATTTGTVRAVALVAGLAAGLILLPPPADAGKTSSRSSSPSKKPARQYFGVPPGKVMAGKASLRASADLGERRTRSGRKLPRPAPTSNASNTPSDRLALTPVGPVRIPVAKRTIGRKTFGGLKGRRLSLTSVESTDSVQSFDTRPSVELPRLQRGELGKPDSTKLRNKDEVMKELRKPK